MLPKFYQQTESTGTVQIRKFINAEDVSYLGAFPCGEAIDIEVTVSHRFGSSGVVLRICKDGERDVDIPLDFCRSDNREDVYCCTVDTEELCRGEDQGDDQVLHSSCLAPDEDSLRIALEILCAIV